MRINGWLWSVCETLETRFLSSPSPSVTASAAAAAAADDDVGWKPKKSADMSFRFRFYTLIRSVKARFWIRFGSGIDLYEMIVMTEVRNEVIWKRKAEYPFSLTQSQLMQSQSFIWFIFFLASSTLVIVIESVLLSFVLYFYIYLHNFLQPLDASEAIFTLPLKPKNVFVCSSSDHSIHFRPLLSKLLFCSSSAFPAYSIPFTIDGSVLWVWQLWSKFAEGGPSE